MLVTCMAISFAGMLRYSDLARVLVHHDLMRFYPDRVELFLYTSKTDQHCEGALVPIGRVPGRYCAVGLLEDLLREGAYKRFPEQLSRPEADGTTTLYDSEDVGPLLRIVAKNRLRKTTALLPDVIAPLSYNTYSKALKQFFVDAGVEKRLSTHSLRIGGASEAVNNGAERVIVRKIGRWATDTVFERCYVRDNGGAKQRVALHMGLAELP
jgi:integrase